MRNFFAILVVLVLAVLGTWLSGRQTARHGFFWRIWPPRHPDWSRPSKLSDPPYIAPTRRSIVLGALAYLAVVALVVLIVVARAWDLIADL